MNYIESSPETRNGKPIISGTRITVADVVLMHRRLGRALEEIAGTFDLPLAGVYEAMAYYYDHKDEIDQSLDQEEALAQAFKQNNRSLLHEKLEALSHG
jgi:uncharacterized protein (DUF433 family)